MDLETREGATELREVLRAKLPKTLLVFTASLLLAVASNLIFRVVQYKVEPVDAWSEQTVMVIRHANKGDFWNITEEILSSLDPEFIPAIRAVEQKTGSSPFVLAKNLLPAPIELLIIKKENAENYPLQYDFVLVTKALGPGVENLPTALQAARDFASWYLPARRFIKLRDGTVVAGSVADPLNIPTKSSFYGGNEIKFIKESGLPFEFAYAQNEGWLYFSTSKLAVEQLIGKGDQKIPFQVFKKNCASPGNGTQVFFNPRLFRVERANTYMALGTPVGSLASIFAPIGVKVRSEGLVLNWKRCGF